MKISDLCSMALATSGEPDQAGLRRRRSVWTAMADSRGFTLIEIVVVLTIMVIMLTISALVFGAFSRRTSARHAASLFVRDLVLARGAALRARERVTIRFDEIAQEYLVLRESGDTLVMRRLPMDRTLSFPRSTFSSQGTLSRSTPGASRPNWTSSTTRSGTSTRPTSPVSRPTRPRATTTTPTPVTARATRTPTTRSPSRPRTASTAWPTSGTSRSWASSTSSRN